MISKYLLRIEAFLKARSSWLQGSTRQNPKEGYRRKWTSEAVKAFNVQAGPRAGMERIEEVSVHTGKHYDYTMDRIFFGELGLAKPGTISE